MYKHSQLLNFVVTDIETIPEYKTFDEMPEDMQTLWLQKHHYKAYEKEIENRKKEIAVYDRLASLEGITVPAPTINEVYVKEACLHPEFAKIYCISIGMFSEDMQSKEVDSFCEATEKATIQAFLNFLHKVPDTNLCGQNINEFDVPFILRRMWINKIVDNYPTQLQLMGAKPWTIGNVDHMQNWKAGMWAPISLDLNCRVLGIPSPKDKFSNADVSTLLFNGKITKKDVIQYCEKDIVALMDVILLLSTPDNNFEKGTFSKKFYKTAKA